MDLSLKGVPILLELDVADFHEFSVNSSNFK